MSSRQDGKPSKRAAVSVAIAAVRDECRFMVRRMATPIEPHETSVKAQFNKVARITGLPPRRIKDFWHGYLNSIPAHQDRTIRNAYRKWLEDAKAKALANLQQYEMEHADLTRAAADYSSQSWERAVASRAGAGAVGAAQSAAADST